MWMPTSFANTRSIMVGGCKRQTSISTTLSTSPQVFRGIVQLVESVWLDLEKPRSQKVSLKKSLIEMSLEGLVVRLR